MSQRSRSAHEARRTRPLNPLQPLAAGPGRVDGMAHCQPTGRPRQSTVAASHKLGSRDLRLGPTGHRSDEPPDGAARWARERATKGGRPSWCSRVACCAGPSHTIVQCRSPKKTMGEVAVVPQNRMHRCIAHWLRVPCALNLQPAAEGSSRACCGSDLAIQYLCSPGLLCASRASCG